MDEHNGFLALQQRVDVGPGWLDTSALDPFLQFAQPPSPPSKFWILANEPPQYPKTADWVAAGTISGSSSLKITSVLVVLASSRCGRAKATGPHMPLGIIISSRDESQFRSLNRLVKKFGTNGASPNRPLGKQVT
jgi:hypothetical protein